MKVAGMVQGKLCRASAQVCAAYHSMQGKQQARGLEDCIHKQWVQCAETACSRTEHGQPKHSPAP